MSAKAVLIGLIAGALVIALNWPRMLLFTLLWRGLLAGIGVFLAITFAEKSVEVFVETKGSTSSVSQTNQDLSQEKIISEEERPEEVEPASDVTGGAGPDEAVSAAQEEGEEIEPEQPSAEENVGAETEEGKALNDENASEIADVISDTMNE